MWHYISLALAILIGTLAQIGLKEGTTKSDTIKSLIIEPYILVSLIAYGVAAIFYISAIRQIPLSIAFPSVASSYVLVALISHLLWAEPFGKTQILGIGLIILGIYILGLGTKT
tara:strand:- start:798 stop:1139 length:342 start_codon:yes stop_codon:yes gene_type:complete